MAPIQDLAINLNQNDVVVMEGAQGFNLDPNHGQYPYCTSSPCTIAGARQCLPLNLDEELNAMRINQTRDWIISKSDVLTDNYQPMLNFLDELVKKGQLRNFFPKTQDEHVLYQFMMDTNFDDDLYKEIIKLGAFQLVHQGVTRQFQSWEEMQKYIINLVEESDLPNLDRIVWWDTAQSEVEMVE